MSLPPKRYCFECDRDQETRFCGVLELRELFDAGVPFRASVPLTKGSEPDRPRTRELVKHLRDHASVWETDGEALGLALRHSTYSRAFVRSVLREWEEEDDK